MTLWPVNQPPIGKKKMNFVLNLRTPFVVHWSKEVLLINTKESGWQTAKAADTDVSSLQKQGE